MLFRSFSGLIALILTAVLLYFAMKSLRRSGIFKRIVMAGLIIVAGPPILMITLSLLNELVGTSANRFRLTLEVETPEGLKTGSSVIQTSRTRHLLHWNPSAPSSDTRVKGEAIFLDLGHGKNMVATLAFGPTGSNVYWITILPAKVFDRHEGGLNKEPSSWEGRAELTGDLIPTLVTFADPADPATLSVVQPDQFESFFGPGYRFKGMWLEMTKDEVTDNGIRGRFPWLVEMTKYIHTDNKGHIYTPFNGKFNYAISPFFMGII